MHYNYKDEGTYTIYEETGNGFGGGMGLRVYLNSYKLEGLWGGVGIDLISTNWKWEDRDNRILESDEGNTMIIAFYTQIGYKITIRDNMYFELSLVMTEFLTGEEIEGTDAIYSPSESSIKCWCRSQ